MRILLAAPTPPDISAFGVRALAALLKRAGHQVSCLFLPGGIERLTRSGEFAYRYSDRALAGVIELARSADLVGVSLLSLYLDRARALTQAIHERTGVPVVWGGTHPTVRPAESLADADYVCVGEGEGAFLELAAALAAGRPPAGIANLAVAGPLFAMPAVRPLVRELDELPFPDFGLEGHYLHDPRADEVRPMTTELMARALPLMPDFGHATRTVYRTMTSRGCPHRCSYCVNAALAGLNPGEPYLRRHAPEYVVAEIEGMLARYPFIRGVHFFDDVFTSAPLAWLAEFGRLYRRRIELPFYCQVSPVTIDEQRMELLLDSGLIFIEMGVQTGSAAERRLYGRRETDLEVRRAAALFGRYRNRLLTPRYHVILDNPWAGPADGRATLALLTGLPRPFKLCLSSLTLYPGTELAARARAEGKLTDEAREVYRKPFERPLPGRLNFLISLADVGWLPRRLLRTLGGGGPLRLLDRPALAPFYAGLERARDGLRLAAKGVGALGRGQLWRIRRYLRRAR